MTTGVAGAGREAQRTRPPRRHLLRGAAVALVVLNVAAVALCLAAVTGSPLLPVTLLLVLAPLDVAALGVATVHASPRPVPVRRLPVAVRTGRFAGALALTGLAAAAVLAGSGWSLVLPAAAVAALVVGGLRTRTSGPRWATRTSVALLLAAPAPVVAGAWLSRDALEPYALFVGVAIGVLLLAGAVLVGLVGWAVAALSARARSTPAGAAPRPR
ncbi:hypothetical protein JQN72_02670 [Phycicoccus sp. CSK15P-2]|uniref:hypothetical protein n=1 Tax=Phycicoccus sp. CSK15P-2 TaxID=2807627 RepID=UPI0019522ADC|nr:hypothetical protein [Phycicoccus sp. CSK15P-2]MBM6403151.1 hypothetical protein [Phycicoccus sp. CSK15P-2]